MEIPAELQERTDSLFQELKSELGKHGANQFVLMRTVMHFEENTSVIIPQELMNTGIPSTEDFWDKYVSSPPADDSDQSRKVSPDSSQKISTHEIRLEWSLPNLLSIAGSHSWISRST